MRIDAAYAALTDAAPDTLAAGEARNGAVHLVSLSLSKSADGLIDPKLVLAWLMQALGAPASLVGLLVPIRESLALAPQLALARWVERSENRRFFWAAGSALQGLAALGIVAAALLLDGAAAGWVVVGCLAALATARSACSISYKDALARSIPKTRRGAVSGAAATVAAAATLAFGAALSVGIIPLDIHSIAAAITVAGAFWLVASATFLLLHERQGDGGPDTDHEPLAHLFSPLANDAQLRRFIMTRGLLTVTALAPPYLVLLAGAHGGGGLGHLGPMVIASAGASILSSYVWGRLSDRSSRRTLIWAAALGAAALGGAAAVGEVLGGLGGTMGAAAALFIAQIAYAGVRAGRKLHLTDMTTDDRRARYTALSNTAIGAVLMLGGGLGVVADLYGPAAVLAICALVSLSAIPFAWSLDEVQQAD